MAIVRFEPSKKDLHVVQCHSTASDRKCCVGTAYITRSILSIEFASRPHSRTSPKLAEILSSLTLDACINICLIYLTESPSRNWESRSGHFACSLPCLLLKFSVKIMPVVSGRTKNQALETKNNQSFGCTSDRMSLCCTRPIFFYCQCH